MEARWVEARWMIGYRIDHRLGPAFLCKEELAAMIFYGRGGKRFRCALH